MHFMLCNALSYFYICILLKLRFGQTNVWIGQKPVANCANCIMYIKCRIKAVRIALWTTQGLQSWDRTHSYSVKLKFCAVASYSDLLVYIYRSPHSDISCIESDSFWMSSSYKGSQHLSTVLCKHILANGQDRSIEVMQYTIYIYIIYI